MDCIIVKPVGFKTQESVDSQKHKWYAASASVPISSVEEATLHLGGDDAMLDDVFDEGIQTETDLMRYLERRIHVGTYFWNVGAVFQTTVTPWDIYFANSDILDKLGRYKLFRSDFEVEIYVKGTKFHAGMLMASVKRYGVENLRTVISSDVMAVTRSQRPRILLEAGASQDGSITVPFIYTANWWPLHARTDEPLRNQGVVTIEGFGDLVAVNGYTAPVEISVYLRAKNVKYSGATAYKWTGAAAASVKKAKKVTPMKVKSKKKASKAVNDMGPNDEFNSDGPVSSIASAVASAAGQLVSVPIIGKFARASQMAATTVSNIASLFGFSKPTYIDKIHQYRPLPTGQLALVDGFDNSMKLSTLAKQEITVDPTSFGLPPVDEMSHQFLSSVESYYGSFTWDPTDAPTAAFGQLVVDPMASRVAGADVYMTSLAFMSLPFKYWSGTLKYRFVFIASSFHSGKCAIIYEPNEEDFAGTDAYHRNVHHVVDLATDRDIEVEIGWTQDKSYLLCSDPDDGIYSSSGGSAIPTMIPYTNGRIYLAPFTELAVPDGITPVKILVFISASDDFEVMEPRTSPLARTSVYAAASTNEPVIPLVYRPKWVACSDSGSPEVTEESQSFEQHASATVHLSSSVDYSDVKPLLYFGEKIVSAREMIKRFVMYRRILLTGSTARYGFLSFSSFPMFMGKVTGAVNQTGAGDPYNYNGVTYLNYYARAYGLWRGSVRYKIYREDGNVSYTVMRTPGVAIDTAGYTPQSTLADQDTTAASVFNDYRNNRSGLAISSHSVNNVMEFEIPYYAPLRGSNVDPDMPRTYDGLTGYFAGEGVQVVCAPYTGNATDTILCAAGDDFGLYCFNGAGTVTMQTPPAP